MNITSKQRQNAYKWARESVSDFAAKVAPVYELLDFKWSKTKDEKTYMEVPSVKDIKDCLYWLIDDLSEDEENFSISTGGLTVSIQNDGAGEYCSISMEVKEVSTYI